MKKPRVVITGIGCVTPIGTGPCALWHGVRAGKSAVAQISRFDASPFSSQVAAEVPDFEPLEYLDEHAVRRTDRFAQFGIVAARQAAEDASLVLGPCERERAGVSLGSALGGIAYAEGQHDVFAKVGIKAVSPTLAIAVYGGASGSNIAIDLGLSGPNLSNASSCASGAMAIGEAVRVIQRGDADVMLAGGVDTPLAPLTFGAFALIRALSLRNHDPATASRPFDSERDGFVMAEGSAILVLENRRRAERRGARMYAEIMGYAQTNDAHHMTAPRPDGRQAARAITLALCDAGVSPSEIEYVNAHATGTRLGDPAEGRAIRAALGDRMTPPPVSGTKGLYGHALGASGAIETAISTLAVTHGFLPGTTNLGTLEPDCPIAVLGPAGQARAARRVLTTSFGFGGANAALVLGAISA